ncbi:MAG: hypothetical protein R3F43_03535 [bacterium]
MEQVAVTSPSLVIQITGGGYALIADASLASAGSIADVVAGHPAHFAARSAPSAPTLSSRRARPRQPRPRNVRIEDFLTVALRSSARKPGDDPSSPRTA